MIFFGFIYPEKNNLFLLMFIENIDIIIDLEPPDLVTGMFWLLNFAYLTSS